MKNWNKMKMTLLVFLGLTAEHDKKLELSAEDKAKLNKLASGGKEPEGDMTKFADIFAEKFNKEIDALADNEASQQIYADFLAEHQIDAAPEGEDAPGAGVTEGIVPSADAKTTAQAMQELVQINAGLTTKNQKLAADNEKLKGLPEEDKPEAVLNFNPNKNKAVKHSKTHLFASGQDYDAVDRPWNKRLIDAQNGAVSIKASTDWNSVNIEKINEDLGAYSRRNASEIMSILMDGYDVPAHWGQISNVQDEQVFAAIVTGSVTQAYKSAFLPKNKQRFVPVKNKIFDKQIDLLWEPKDLKAIEKSWLNMFFNEGSTPYKDSFVRFLITEILKKARKEDKISIFKGVYSDPSITPTTAGSFLNAMNGFLKIISTYRDTAYRSHALGKPTEVNIYDYVNNFVKALPYDFRMQTGLVFGMSSDLHKAYHNARELKKGTNMDYVANNTTVDQYDNIMFAAHPQLNGSDFVYITTEDNIGVMNDRNGEESLIILEKFERNIKGLGDYKLGVYVKAFGAAVDPDAPLDYENQIFFSNDVEVLKDVYVPVAADDATPTVGNHNALIIGSNNTTATNITKLDDVVAGVRYYLYGDADTKVSTVKNNANIILSDGDFALSKGNLIVLIGLAGGKVVEYSRANVNDVPEPTKITLAADATTADATNGDWFVTTDNTAATAFTTIENAIVDEVYTIEGGSGTNATTIASGGNFLLTAGFTATDGATLKVVYNGAKFIELSRA